MRVMAPEFFWLSPIPNTFESMVLNSVFPAKTSSSPSTMKVTGWLACSEKLFPTVVLSFGLSTVRKVAMPPIVLMLTFLTSSCEVTVTSNFLSAIFRISMSGLISP